MEGSLSLPPVSKFFVPLPEAKLKGRPKHRLQFGKCYLPGTSEEGIEFFLDAVTHGVPGLWITSSNPEDVRKRWKLSTTPILWVTRTKGGEEVKAKPSEPERILKIAKNYFLSGISRSVVMVDCLLDLVLINGYERTTRMLKGLLEVCVENQAALILPCGGFPPEGVERLKRAIG